MLNILQEIDFIVENFLKGRQGEPFNVMSFDNFNGYKLSCTLVLRKFNSKRMVKQQKLISLSYLKMATE